MQQIIVSSYFEKQRAFRSLVKDIQISLTSKVYKQYGCSLNDFIRMKWNISQAQAYRYLVCAKVLDQLEEFEIQPSYERLCRTLYNTVKTPSQMKLLWSTLLRKTGNRAEIINSTHISQTWKELCKDKKYSKICNYEDDVMKKIEESLNKFSNEKKHKQLKQKKEENKKSSKGKSSRSSSISQLPTPSLSETSLSNQSEDNEAIESSTQKSEKKNEQLKQISKIYTNNINSLSFIPSPEVSISSLSNQCENNNNISPVFNYNFITPNNNNGIYNSYKPLSTPPTECINYLTYPNNIQFQQQPPSQPQQTQPQQQQQQQNIVYYQEIPQQQIIYYC